MNTWSPASQGVKPTTPQKPHATRLGAALILALVILTMLLAMALPFVFSQTTASSGARSWHQHTAANRGAESARTLAVGVGGAGLAQTYNNGYTILNVGINEALGVGPGDEKVAHKLSQDRSEVITVNPANLPLGLNKGRFRRVGGTDIADGDGTISSTWDYRGLYPGPDHAYRPIILHPPTNQGPAPTIEDFSLISAVGTAQATSWNLVIDRGEAVTRDRAAVRAQLNDQQQLTGVELREGINLEHPGLQPGKLTLDPPTLGSIHAGDAWTIITGFRPAAPTLEAIPDAKIHSIAVTRGGLASAPEAWQRPLIELRDNQNRAVARDVVVGPGGSFSWSGGRARFSFASGAAQIIAHGDRWERVKNKQRGAAGSAGRDRFLAESGRTTLGVTLTDESTRLDINHMTPEIWRKLLRHVGCEEALRRRRGRFSQVHYLCHFPNRLDERAYTSTDQLLRAGLRNEELLRILPYITVHARSPGRGEKFGVIDFGTVLELDGDRPIIDLDAYYNQRLAGRHSRAVFWPQGQTDQPPRGYLMNRPDQLLPGNANDEPTPGPGDALALVAAQRLNVHHLPRRIGKDILGLNIELAPEQYFTGVDSLLQFQSKGAKSRRFPQYNGTALALIDPLGRREAWPIIGLRSSGLFRIHSAATASDVRNRPVASEGGTMVAQLLPRDKQLAIRWRSQSDWLGLDLERFLSNTTSWPVPLKKRRNQAILPNSDPTQGAVTAAVQPAPTTSRHIDADWQAQVSAGGDEAEDISVAKLLNNPSLSAGINEQSIRPDGVLIEASDELGWTIGGRNTPIYERSSGEMAPVTIGFWLAPQENWDSSLGAKEVTLLDMRGDSSVTGSQVDGTAGDPDQQNNMRLWFDTKHEHLVLSLYGPAIERTMSIASKFTSDQELSIAADDPATIRWDERSLGSMASGQRRPLAPEQPLAGQHLRYYIKGGMQRGTWYRIEVVIGGPGPGQQALMVNGHPGRNAATLEPGTAPQHGDFALIPQLTLASQLPERPLGSDDYNLYFETIQLRGNPILDKVAASEGKSAAEYCLPESGVIRIGSEYIAYSSRSGNTLQGCYRGRRVSANPTWQPLEDTDERDYDNTDFPEVRTPISEAHEPGDSVLPGDFRQATSGTRLFLGHNFLGADFTNGDAEETDPNGNPNGNRWRHWGRLSAEADDYPDSHKRTVDGDENTIDLIIDENTTEIVCADNWVRPTVWPTRGIIRVYHHYFHYTQFDGKRFSNLTYIPRQRVFDLVRNDNYNERYDNPDSWRPNPPSTFRASSPDEERLGPQTQLVSMEMRSDDGLLNEDALRPREHHYHTWRVLQLEDQDTGRIEWIDYNGVNVDTGVPYIIQRNGWRSRYRGNGRTVFMGAYGQPDTIWQSGARVLPVQTQFGRGHWLETGDVITLVPDGNSNNRTQTQQNIVRFVSKDGFGDNIETSYNANDDWFTFVEPVQQTRFDWEIIVGRGWSGPEMSVWWNNIMRYHNASWRSDRTRSPPSERPDDPPSGMLPRIDIHDVGGPAQLNFGRRDPRRSELRSVDHPTFAVIDDFYSRPSRAERLAAIDQQPQPNLRSRNHEDFRGEISTETALTLADRNTNNRTHTPAPWPGPDTRHTERRLFSIGGEIVAYHVNDSRVLMHNGFGSAPTDGQRLTVIKRMPKRLAYQDPVVDGRRTRIFEPIANQDLGIWEQGPTVLPLPLGPVQELSDGIPNEIGPVEMPHQYQHAPAHIAMSADGETATVVSLIRTHMRSSNGGLEPWTTPWLQGLYHTTRTDPGEGVLIGMWPRFAPILPDRTSSSWTELNEDDQRAALRSRMFTWVSLVADAYQSQYGRVKITGAANPRDGSVMSRPDRFSLEARALAKGAAWRTAAGASSDGSANLTTFLPSLDGRYARARDGAEVRLHFRYFATDENPIIAPGDADLPFRAMEMGGMTPAIGSASLQFTSEGGILHNTAEN